MIKKDKSVFPGLGQEFERIVASWLLVPILLLAACQTGEEDPLDGTWRGMGIVFEKRGELIVSFGISGLSCQGEACLAVGDLNVASRAIPIINSGITTTLEGESGEVKVSLRFDSAVSASGTLMLNSTCCAVSRSFTAAPAPADPDQDSNLVEEVSPDASDPLTERITEQMTELRDKLGLEAATSDPALISAAASHAQYYVLHCKEYGSTGLSPHEETPSWPQGFSGTTFEDRVGHFGFQGQPGWEIMALSTDPSKTFSSWLESVYHRIPLVHPAMRTWGMATAEGSCGGRTIYVDVMDLGRVELDSGAPVYYPVPGQTDVPVSWSGEETPQPPLPAGEAYPSGPVLSITFPDENFTIDAHSLKDEAGAEIPHQFLTRDNDPAGLLSTSCVIYAYSPLEPDSTYQASISGYRQGIKQTWSWKFTTAP